MDNNINILVDDYANMNMWAKFVLNGIHEAASKKKIPIQTFFSSDVLLKALSGNRKKIVITIAASKVRSEQFLRFFNGNDVHPIFINMQFPDSNYSYSSITPDCFLASYQLTMAILSEFPESSMLVGYNKDSFIDKDRLNGFLKAVKEKKIQYEIYSVDNDILNCLDKAIQNLNKYKNIICINDIVAVPLIKKMRKSGYDPANFNIASLRNMKIGEFNKPSITSVTSDNFALGITAVEAFVLLNKKYVKNIHINTGCRILFRESTHLKKTASYLPPKQETNNTIIDLYSGTVIKKIEAIEKMIINCDTIDLNIINGLLKGYTYEKISEITSMAVSSIKYRIKKMEYNLNTKNKEEFLSCLNEYDLNL